MEKKIFLILIFFSLISLIPIANAQISFGETAYQKSTEIILDEFGIIQAKHVVNLSNNQSMVNLFEGVIIESITVTNENEEELEFGIIGTGSDGGSITILSTSENAIIKYNLENVVRQSDNMITLNVGYPKTFSILFSDKIELIFLNNNLIQLGDKKGISINGGGYVNLEYYSEIPKVIKKVQWEENEFNVEIISDIEIKKFNFDQTSKSISFQINEKNKFVTINMEEKLLGGPYVILLDNEKIEFSKYSNKESHISLSIKPESSGQITIIGTTVIPEFSMFIPLIAGFFIILSVPLMKKFNLH